METDAAHTRHPARLIWFCSTEQLAERLRETTSGRVPLYPPIAGNADPALVGKLCASVARHGCNGAMVTLDPSRKANVSVLGEGLREVVSRG